MKEKWWKSEIVYQVYPKSFYDSNDDGIGDVRGVIEKLDYLEDLGVTSLWLCPIFKSPMADNGYDISDYFGIAPEFGHLEDVKELIKEAKKRSIKIIMDLVVNHTSDEHPWFQAALASPDSPYREYYIFQESKEVPNNWRSIFGGSVWEKLDGEECYYYHTFHKKQPDLNWENPQLREEIYQMVTTWLEMGIAGFRIDAITFIKKDLSFASVAADGVDGLARCTKVSRNQPGIDIFLKELRERCFERFDCVTIAEAPGVPYHQLEDFIGEEGHFSMIFDFKHADLDVKSGSEWFQRQEWSLPDLYQILEDSQLAIQESGWGAPFIENHDQPRATTKYLKEYATDKEAVKAMGLMYFFLRGTPFIYQGQELGLVNFTRENIAEFDDISSIDQYIRGIEEGLTEAQSLECINLRSRDNSRTPMPWSEGEHVGFSHHQPWLAVSEHQKERTVEYQLLDPTSVYHFYKKMIALKKEKRHQALSLGRIEFPVRKNPNIFLYRRYDDKSSYLVAVNLSDKEERMVLEKPIQERIIEHQNTVVQEGNELIFPAFAGLILKEEV